MENIVYLDTHLVVWLYGKRLDLIPDYVLGILNNNDLLISPIVKLELQYLFEIERIKKQAGTILKALHSEIGLKFCVLDFPNIINSAVKEKWTRDPFDRIITAQASVNKAILLTKDLTILDNYNYAKWDKK